MDMLKLEDILINHNKEISPVNFLMDSINLYRLLTLTTEIYDTDNFNLYLKFKNDYQKKYNLSWDELYNNLFHLIENSYQKNN